MTFDWSVQGGPVMHPLLACSLISAAIPFKQAPYLARVRRRRDHDRLDCLADLMAQGRVDEAQRLRDGSDNPVARVVRSDLLHRHESLEAGHGELFSLFDALRGRGRSSIAIPSTEQVEP